MINKRVVMAVVHAPILNETFHSIVGYGAWLNQSEVFFAGLLRRSHDVTPFCSA